MGKGDKKTKRGKLFQGSYGVRRRKKGSSKKELVNPMKKESIVGINESRNAETVEVKEVKAEKSPKPAKEPVPSKSPKPQPHVKKESKTKKSES